MNAILTRNGTENNWNIDYRNIFWISFLFIYSTNFYGWGVYVPLLFLPYIWSCISKNSFDKKFWSIVLVLFSFCLIYGITVYLYGFATKGILLIRIVYPISLFIIGYTLVSGSNHYKNAYRYLFTIIASFTIYGFFSVLKTILVYGNIETAVLALGGRFVLNIWDDNIASATIINMRLSYGLALLPIVFLTLGKARGESPKYFKIVSLISFLACAFAILQLANRTGIAITIASVITVYLFSRKLNVKKVANIFLVIIVFLFIRFLFTATIFKNYWENTPLFYRLQKMDATEDPRLDAWKSAFFGVFENPMGNKQSDLPLAYAHNLWLDVGFEAGLVPFVLLLVFTFLSLKSLYTFINNDHPVLLKGIIISLYTSCLLTFFLEPIIQAWFTYFVMFCFILGIVYRLNKIARDS